MRAVQNPFASDSASELMSAVNLLKGGMESNSAIVSGASLGLAILGGAFFIGYRLYTNYKEKLHQAEIKLINELHSRYLTNIIVAADGAKLELPAIFQRRSDPEGGWDSMHLNDQEVEALAKNSAKIPDEKELNIYRDNITRAMNDLKAYYFSHDEEDRLGLTCLVLTYLMHIVDKLLRFEGYVYDIAYLDAMMQFVHFYAKSKGEDSRHNKKLSDVYAYLKTAKEELETHYATRSQSMILKELRGDCCQASSDGIIKLARFVTNDEKALQFINMDRLGKNILRPETITRTGPKKIVTFSTGASGMPICRITTWVTTLADYWQKARNPSTMVKDILPLSALSLPVKLIEEETEHLLLLFFSGKCFRNKQEFQVAKEKLLEALSNFAKLLQLEISLVCQCNEIEGIIQNRGMMEVNNPDHCRAQYARLGELRDQIGVHVNLVKKQFAELDSFNSNPMRPQEQFLTNLKRSLDVIQNDVNLNVEAMLECRKRFKECQAKWALESQEASLVGRAIAIACELPSANQPTMTSSIPRLSMSEISFMPSESAKPSLIASLVNQSVETGASIKLPTSRSSVASVDPQQNALLPPLPRSLPRFFSSTRASQGSVPVSPYHRARSSQPAVSPRSEVSTVPAAEKKKQEAYMRLFESTIQARASYHPAIQLIAGMRDVLADYIGVGFKQHLMSLTRHHLDAVKVRVELITVKLGTLRDPLEAREFLEMQLHELLLVRGIKGTLKDRIDYLVERCREAGYHASNNTLVAPVASGLLEAHA